MKKFTLNERINAKSWTIQARPIELSRQLLGRKPSAAERQDVRFAMPHDLHRITYTNQNAAREFKNIAKELTAPFMGVRPGKPGRYWRYFDRRGVFNH